MSSIYTEKWVLFLDILGFGAYINDEKKSEEFAEIVLPLFDNILRELQEDGYFGIGDMSISQFSDTFVISGKDHNTLAFFTCYIQKKLLEENLLSRGAITYGKVFHNGSQFIGPAITRAYNLEKSEAIYPRVIIDPNCDILIHNGQKDFDGYHYINFLENRQEFVDTYNRLLNKCFINIAKLYEKHKNTKHRGKYTWLKRKGDEVKEVRRKQEDLKKYKHKETYDMLPLQDEIF